MEWLIENTISVCNRCIAWADGFFEKIAGILFEKKKVSILMTILLTLAMVAVMYLLNRHTTLIVDDYGYSFNQTGQRFSSMQEVFVRLWRHYFDWGGRVVVHFFAIMFLWIGKSVFNVFNALAFISMVFVMYYLAIGSWPCFGKRNYALVLLGIFFMLFAFTPKFGQDFLWLVGSCNYLWGMLLILLMMIPLRAQLFFSENKFKNPLWFPIFFVGNVLAGWTNENMGVTLAAMTVFCMIYQWRENHKVPAWMYASLLGVVIGSAFLVLAPGNFVRLHHTGGVHFFGNFVNITKTLLKPSFTLIPFWLILGLRVLTEKVQDPKKNVLLYLFLGGTLASAYAMVVSPFWADRAKIGTIVLAIISVMTLYPYVEIAKVESKKLLLLVGVLMLTFLGSDLKMAYKDIVSYEKRDTAKVQYTLKEKEKGNMDIIVPRNYPSTKYCAAYGLEDINENPKHWTSRGFARYFGVKSVRTVKNK